MDKKIPIIVISLLAVIVISFFILESFKIAEPENNGEPPSNGQASPSVNLYLEEYEDRINFIAEVQGDVYVSTSTYPSVYNYPSDSWIIYKWVNDEWEIVNFKDDCYTFCDDPEIDVCEEGLYGCGDGGISAKCQKASLKEEFNWDKKYIDWKGMMCIAGSYFCEYEATEVTGEDCLARCAYYKNVEEGKYKTSFAYQIGCEGNFYADENEILYTEKEFYID